MIRTAALALSFLALTAGEAQGSGQEFEIVVVPGLTSADLPALEDRGAVGLLVPGAGPEISAALARAALARGEVRHSLRGGAPSGAPLVDVRTGALGSAGGPAVYLGLPQGGRQANDRRFPIVVAGRGYEGLLTSEATRIPGLVSVADVAPTALGGEDALGWEPQGEAAAALTALDARIDASNAVRPWAVLLACALLVLVTLVRPAAGVPAFAALLLGNLLLGVAGVSSAWAVLLALALAVLAGGPLLALLLRTPAALGVAFASVLAAYLLVLGLDGTSVALSPFGPNQNARFYGLSNLLETLLLVPALAAAAVLGSRFGWPAFAAVGVLALVVIAGNRFGADGGGAVVLAAGFAALATLAVRERRRAFFFAPLAAVALVALVLVLDLATGASSHVTRAVRDGPAELGGDLRDRVALSVERVTESWYVGLACAALLLALVVLVAQTARRGLVEGSAVPLALAVAVATSLVVNDSPLEVLLVGAVGYLAAERGMLRARWPGPSRPRWSPLPLPWSRDAAAARPSRPRPRP